jgi:hypothetical protein
VKSAFVGYRTARDVPRNNNLNLSESNALSGRAQSFSENAKNQSQDDCLFPRNSNAFPQFGNRFPRNDNSIPPIDNHF